MLPLIDSELERIDRNHAKLTQLSGNLVDAINMYHTLMRDAETVGHYGMMPSQQPHQMYRPPNHMPTNGMYNPQANLYSPTSNYGTLPHQQHQQPPQQMIHGNFMRFIVSIAFSNEIFPFLLQEINMHHLNTWEIRIIHSR